ncbi:MAG: DNA mismatch repair protein MutS, partial [Verrucomicrobiota bacterium]
MSADAQLTPMMAQYRRIKSELPKDALLFFRLGDFYELFFEDAQAGAQLLNVALTKRGIVPMCGIPFHAANGYIAKILRAGRKVAICDQVEEARPGQLVKREVTQILSPGTHFDERLLVAERNNFLATISTSGKTFGLALVDLTTGDFKTTEIEGDAALRAELERLRPAEIIFPDENLSLKTLLHGTAICSGYDDWVFAAETAQFTVRDHFKVATLDGFGLKNRDAAIGAAGAALHYLAQHLRRDLSNLTRISFYQPSDFLALDATTLRNLEILEPLHRDAPRNTCLYGALNRTVTPMGARRLRDWLSQPLASVEPIQQRQEVVKSWIENSSSLENFRAQLTEVRDLERTIGRLCAGTGNARDLLALKIALEQIPSLKKILNNMVGTSSTSSQTSLRELPMEKIVEDAVERVPAKLLENLSAQLSESPDLVELIGRAIVDEPPLALKEGGIIRDNFDENLDEIKRATTDGKNWIAKLQQDEIEKTGITSLKVRFNSVFGYYIEITRSNLDKVPQNYIRKQTIANGERFITPELKEMEGKILGAEERSVKLEYDLFLRVREEVLGQLAQIQTTASALAQLDVLGSFAETARLYNHCQPTIGSDGVLQISEGRHPVLDQVLTEERFVPNDTALASVATFGVPPSGGPVGDATKPPEGGTPNFAQIALITGPNMA